MRAIASLALDFLFTQPITSIAEMSQHLDKAYNTASNILKQFIALGFVSQVIIHKRNKLYPFESYLALLEASVQIPSFGGRI